MNSSSSDFSSAEGTHPRPRPFVYHVKMLLFPLFLSFSAVVMVSSNSNGTDSTMYKTSSLSTSATAFTFTTSSLSTSSPTAFTVLPTNATTMMTTTKTTIQHGHGIPFYFKVLAIIATALFFIVGCALLFSTIYMILTVNKKKRLAMAELEKYEKSSG